MYEGDSWQVQCLHTVNPLLSTTKRHTETLFCYRFICSEDREWFEKAVSRVIQEHVDPSLVPALHPEPYFVDFLQDAPEPVEEDEDVCCDAPKIYELVWTWYCGLLYDICNINVENCHQSLSKLTFFQMPNFEFLLEKLMMYQTQYNETVRGSSLDLVFFTDAMTHLVKVRLEANLTPY